MRVMSAWFPIVHCVAPEVGGDKDWADWRKHCTTGQVTWKLNQN